MGTDGTPNQDDLNLNSGDTQTPQSYTPEQLEKAVEKAKVKLNKTQPNLHWQKTNKNCKIPGRYDKDINMIKTLK